MRNLYIHATDSKSRAAERGSPGTYAQTFGVPYSPEDFVRLSGTPAETSIAMHEQLAQNWGCWGVFCKDCYELVRPFYMFQLELVQQYFSYLFGMPQCLGEPLGEQQLKFNGRGKKPGPTPGPRLITREQREQLAEAMDIAIGATPELWAEVVQVGRARAAAA